MNLSSKEWIKYLTLPIWCKSTEPYYYEFPPLEKNFFLTEYVYEAFVILSNQEESTYLNYAKKQEDQEKTIKSIIKLYKEKDEKINEKDAEIKDKDAMIKEKDAMIKELIKENKQLIKKLKVKNSSSIEKEKKNGSKGKKKKGPKKYRKTTIKYADSSDD